GQPGASENGFHADDTVWCEHGCAAPCRVFLTIAKTRQSDHRPYHHRRRKNQIPIALAAQPGAELPATSCLGAFGRLPPQCEGPLIVAGVQKPAQVRTHALQQKAWYSVTSSARG